MEKKKSKDDDLSDTDAVLTLESRRIGKSKKERKYFG